MTDEKFWRITTAVAGSKPKWTNKLPTADGLYWMKLRPKYNGQKARNRIWLIYFCGLGEVEVILPEDVGIIAAMPLVMNEWAGPLEPRN